MSPPRAKRIAATQYRAKDVIDIDTDIDTDISFDISFDNSFNNSFDSRFDISFNFNVKLFEFGYGQLPIDFNYYDLDNEPNHNVVRDDGASD
ncbi:MAG: hypothetical protein Q9157_003239 [Trypethelium eluteriae]